MASLKMYFSHDGATQKNMILVTAPLKFGNFLEFWKSFLAQWRIGILLMATIATERKEPRAMAIRHYDM